MPEQVVARHIIGEIVHNMHASGEELYSHTLVPSFYQVFLHTADFDRLEPIVARIVSDAKHALDIELAKANRTRVIDWLLGRTAVKYESADRSWRIELIRNPDEDQRRGTVKVVSQLTLPAKQSAGEGASTRFNVTRSDDDRDGSSRPAGNEPVRDEETPRAEFRVDGMLAVARMVRWEFLIGRGSPDCPVDLAIASPSVSEVHVRVRQTADGVFYLENQGRFGTKVDGMEIPRGTEIRLSPVARIELANGSAIVKFTALQVRS
jgi:hypothetical protein